MLDHGPHTDRTHWIDQRVTDLMLDSDATADLVEDIHNHGGLAHQGFCGALRRMMASETHLAAQRALDDAAQILQAFAFLRAQREYDRIPLCPQ